MSTEKKLTTQEIVKQQLERKKQAQSNGKNAMNLNSGNHRMKSQQSKKPSNTRRKIGG
ncbi:hypothetical protein GCM10011351_00470 [Paraliobacillus quinghaiensis]|uniref:Uncharacterized protein n=1 Tax=Paraliobacillus quinghaiensis TaxID=470815 RepID=A0A917TCJ2_9BACI|nr:hypothetical protein [Paraliobacillus quinghaiensis]GGM18585.1 hypothetical protein GCM10011351_00470 [Paraliobacillus quinghaiensis]